MKVVLINHSDTLGGASVVTFRLMEALRGEGVDARMLVGSKQSDSPFVEQASSRARTRVPFYIEHARIFAQNGFSRRRLFQASIATDGLALSEHPMVKEADAVVLNWVNQGLLSLKEIGKTARMKPTFWTMHDQWNFTSICHHTGACDRFRTHCSRCHLLGWMRGAHDLSYRVFDRKKALYESSPITFIAVSDWLAGRAATSALFEGQRLEVIPNAFPVETFSGAPKLSRGRLGLPEGKKLITFCAARIDDPGKDLPTAVRLLNEVAATHGEDAAAVFVGACRNPGILESLRLPYTWLGPVSSTDTVASIMGHSQAVLSTSPFETLSTTMIEAQAAGATPVCFTHDGRGDIVADGVTGYSLSRGSRVLAYALDHPIDREALKKAAERYSAASVAKKYVALIENRFKVTF